MKRDIKVNRSFRKRGLGKYYTKIHRDWMSFRPPNPRLIFDISPDKSSQQQILCSDYYDNEATCLVHEAQYYVFCTNSWEQNLIVDSWKTKLVYPFPSRIYILHTYICMYYSKVSRKLRKFLCFVYPPVCSWVLIWPTLTFWVVSALLMYQWPQYPLSAVSWRFLSIPVL